MGVRQRIEREVRAAFRQARRHGRQVNVNKVDRVNAVVVSNTGGGAATACAHQTAPIVQQPGEPTNSDGD